MDISSYQICSNPKIWVFDDLVSTDLLNHVDNNFVPQSPYINDAGETFESWTVDDPSLSKEFINLLVRISGIIPVVRNNSLKSVTIGNSKKKEQSCHMDRCEVGGRFQHVSEDDVGFLDMSRQDVRTRHRRSGGNAQVVVPTISFVVYFKDYPGGVTFPDAPGFDSTAATVGKFAGGIRGDEDGGGMLSIDGKRGRIIMFRNYKDDHSSSANPTARHYGTFDPLVSKRNFIGGILSNENPPDEPSSSGEEAHGGVPGLLYGVCESVIQPTPQGEDEDPLQGYRFGPHGGHHEGYDDMFDGNLSVSISRETVKKYSDHHKEALLRLLMIFSKVVFVSQTRGRTKQPPSPAKQVKMRTRQLSNTKPMRRRARPPIGGTNQTSIKPPISSSSSSLSKLPNNNNTNNNNNNRRISSIFERLALADTFASAARKSSCSHSKRSSRRIRTARSVRLSVSVRRQHQRRGTPIPSDVWWHILSMMDGNDLFTRDMMRNEE